MARELNVPCKSCGGDWAVHWLMTGRGQDLATEPVCGLCRAMYFEMERRAKNLAK